MPGLVHNLRTGFKRWVARSLAEVGITGFLAGRDADDGEGVGRLVSPYQQSAWVFAATNLIAGEIAAVPLKFYDGDTAFEEAKFADWWAAPALGPDKKRIPLATVARSLASWAKLEGEFFLLFDDSWFLADSARRGPALPPFIIARPDRVNVVVRAGELWGYEWTDAGGRRRVFVPEQVIHWRDFNPGDEWRGCGALAPAKNAVEGDWLAGRYVTTLMRNNGDQGFIVLAKNGQVTDEQREQILASLRGKRAALRRGEARDLFLDGGDLGVEHPQPKSADANLNATRLANRHEVFIAFGIPASMADITASYSIGSASDRHRLITGTCTGLAAEIAGALAKAASSMTGRTLNAEFDWEAHPVMQEVRAEKIKTAQELWNRGMSWKTINDYLDLGIPVFPGWEVGYLPFSVSPVGAPELAPAADPATDPDLAEEPPAEDEAPEALALRLALLAKKRAAARRIEPGARTVLLARDCGCWECVELVSGDDYEATWADNGTWQRGRSEKEIARWKAHMAARRETIRAMQSRFNRELIKARAEVLAKIERHQKSAPAQTKAAAADFLFDLAKWKKGLQVAMRGAAAGALKKAGEELFAEVGKDDPWTMPPAKALEFLRGRENKMAGVADEVFARVKDAIEEQLHDGATMEAIAAAVRSEFNSLSKGQALRVAQTETAACYGVARDEAMLAAGVQYKQWLTSGNDNVRATHAAANGQTVPVNSDFTVGGEKLSHPGDPSGSAANVINCHCVAIAVAQPD